MSQMDDPNREAVGMAPIWTGADGGEPPPEGGEGTPAGYDPGEYTVEQVNTWLEKHPDQRDAVLESEAAGKARAGILGS
jgi:hypothetical protein